jgi:protein-L-isoaspartate(D-aspartate) O-methyltransferase
MHARTLEELKDYLIPGIVVLDIGSGSGYMTATMAELAGKGSKIYAVDHIEKIIEFSKYNIGKENSYLIDENRIEFIVADGRNG